MSESAEDVGEKTKEKVESFIAAKMGITDAGIETAYRIGRKKPSSGQRPRAIRFKSNEEKAQAMRKKRLLVGEKVYLNHDFTKEQKNQYKTLRQQRDHARCEGKEAYIKAGKLVVKEKPTTNTPPLQVNVPILIEDSTPSHQ